MPRVVVVAYPGVMTSAVFGLHEFFAVAGRHLPDGAMRFQVETVSVGAADGPATVGARNLAQTEAECDVLIVPPSLEGELPTLPDLATTQWLRRRYQEGTVMAAVCAGTFLLAETGLLDGRPATTHWFLGEQFQRRFPKVRLDTTRMLVDDGDVITAGGVSAYQDLAVHLIGRFASPSAAIRTSRHMLVEPQPRQQALFRRFVPDFAHGDAAIVKAQQFMHRHYRNGISVKRIAAVAGLAERTLLRRFQRAAGLSPSTYLQRLRVDQGCELLETTDASVEAIAYEVGYEDAATFRKLIRAVTGVPAGQYRKRFRPWATST